ncbi:MAG TPA: hypothetical protein VIX73_01035 [Kofleriaceae bacterium]
MMLMMRAPHRLLLTVALCTGCGSVQNNNGDDDGGGDFTLTATPSSINIPIAGSGKVTIAINRTGSAADVMLAAQNLPNGLTATFATNPVPAASNSTDVTFAVAPGAPAGMANVTIVGTSGSVQKTTTVAVTSTTITVSGTVRGKRSGITVRLVGKAAVTSDADGNFSFSDVSPPYDLYTLGNSGSVIGNPVPSVIYYRGLTRPDPVVNAPSTFGLIVFPRRSTATLGGTTSTAPGTMLVVWSTGGSARVMQTNAYSFTASWISNANNQIDGTLYGFQFSTKPTGAPDAFTGYGSMNATLMANTPATVNLIMAAPNTAALTGSITSPSGFPNPTIALTQQLGTSSIELWSGTTTVADSTIPLIAAGKAALFATATLDNATTSFVHPALTGATDVNFALPAPAVQSAPLNAATGVTGATPFTWNAPPNTVHQVTITTTSTTGTALASYTLFTTTTTGKIPVVPELTLPLNQSFTWNVNGYGPTASIDDAASAAGLQSVSSADFSGQRHWFTNSTDRTFTTAP